MDTILAVDDKFLAVSVFFAVGILLRHVFVHSGRTYASQRTIKGTNIAVNVRFVVQVLHHEMDRLVLSVVCTCTRH